MSQSSETEVRRWAGTPHALGDYPCRACLPQRINENRAALKRCVLYIGGCRALEPAGIRRSFRGSFRSSRLVEHRSPRQLSAISRSSRRSEPILKATARSNFPGPLPKQFGSATMVRSGLSALHRQAVGSGLSLTCLVMAAAHQSKALREKTLPSKSGPWCNAFIASRSGCLKLLARIAKSRSRMGVLGSGARVGRTKRERHG